MRMAGLKYRPPADNTPNPIFVSGSPTCQGRGWPLAKAWNFTATAHNHLGLDIEVGFSVPQGSKLQDSH